MSRRLQFRLRMLFRLTFWAAIFSLVGPPGWAWIKTTYLTPRWQEVGGPGAIQSYQTTISCSFGRDPASVWRLKHRLCRRGSARELQPRAPAGSRLSRRLKRSPGKVSPRWVLPPAASPNRWQIVRPAGNPSEDCHTLSRSTAIFDRLDSMESAALFGHGGTPKLDDWLDLIRDFGEYYDLEGEGPISVDPSAYRRETARYKYVNRPLGSDASD